MDRRGQDLRETHSRAVGDLDLDVGVSDIGGHAVERLLYVQAPQGTLHRLNDSLGFGL